MIKCVEFPNKTFATKEELFDSLREHKKQIIDIKCSTVYKSFEKGLGVYCMPIDDSKFDETTKSAFSNDKENWNIAVNTTKILDSHRDLHIDGIWNKTKKETWSIFICIYSQGTTRTYLQSLDEIERQLLLRGVGNTPHLIRKKICNASLFSYV